MSGMGHKAVDVWKKQYDIPALMRGLGSRNDQQIEPWKQQQPYLESGFDAAKDAFLGQPDPNSEWARTEGARRGMEGSPFEQAARDQLTGTLRGDYLTGGRGFDAALRAASDKIIPMVQSSFGAAGRHGSGLESVAETQGIANAFANLYGQERQNQMGALNKVPGMQGVDYTDIGQVANAGDARRQARERYMRAIGGQYGQNKPNAGALNGIGGMLTGGISGAAAGAPFGPWGAAAGGGIGALASLMNQ